MSLTHDGKWHYYTVSLDFGNEVTLQGMAMSYVVLPQSALYLSGINLVPGTPAYANESRQNSGALKNITIKAAGENGVTLISHSETGK